MNDIAKRTEVVSNALLNSGDVKREFEKNYIETLVKLNPQLPPRYLIDFIHKAQLTGANPALNQIHLTTYFSKKLGHQVGVPVFSYHFFLNIANQTGEYEGVSVDSKVEEVFNPVTSKTVTMLVSTATVRRKGKGEVTFKARWNEFADTRNGMWQSKPYIMLEKTAIANALRWAFPEALSGMYISEEISGDKANTTIETTAAKPDNTQLKETPSKEVSDAKLAAIEQLKNKLSIATKDLGLIDKGNFLKEHLGKSWEEIQKSSLDELLNLIDIVGDYNAEKERSKEQKKPSFKLEG